MPADDCSGSRRRVAANPLSVPGMVAAGTPIVGTPLAAAGSREEQNPLSVVGWTVASTGIVDSRLEGVVEDICFPLSAGR